MSKWNPFNYRWNVEVEGKESVMNDSKFLAQATGWVEVSLTEMRVRDKEEWE